jgi:hypothetical protein
MAHQARGASDNHSINPFDEKQYALQYSSRRGLRHAAKHHGQTQKCHTRFEEAWAEAINPLHGFLWGPT